MHLEMELCTARQNQTRTSQKTKTTIYSLPFTLWDPWASLAFQVLMRMTRMTRILTDSMRTMEFQHASTTTYTKKIVTQISCEVYSIHLSLLAFSCLCSQIFLHSAIHDFGFGTLLSGSTGVDLASLELPGYHVDSLLFLRGCLGLLEHFLNLLRLLSWVQFRVVHNSFCLSLGFGKFSQSTHLLSGFGFGYLLDGASIQGHQLLFHFHDGIS
mmetsp:Transcript_17768/g.24739  ORF Transcript_17768/g.24739 Transcript_17768/m.24739 type:complete len:213 (-) Transcript_17768:1066-1704(-)